MKRNHAMNPQEREVIDGIFERLKQVENQPRDPEAEKYIAGLVARQPYAPYAMAQAMFIQEQALNQFKERVEALENELKQAKEPQNSSGFLSGLWGGGRPAEAPPRTSVPPSGAPMAQQGYAPQGYAPQAPQPAPFPPQGPAGPLGGGGGGFLTGALTTAAGVAGGALLFQGLKGMFGGQHGSGFGNPSGFGDPSQLASASSLEDRTQSRDAHKDTAVDPDDDVPPSDATYDDDDDDDGADDDFGGGGGDDWV
jgi:uncharacterized protein